MWTLPRKTVCAMAPPIIAAAMLSRNEDSTNTIASSANAPFACPGRYFGSTAGTWLSSKCLDSNAKPSNRHSRLERMTHSWARWPTKPGRPSPVLNPVNANLYNAIVPSPVSATCSVWWWNSATPSSVRANKMKSNGMPNAVGGSVAAIANEGVSHSANAAPAMTSRGPMPACDDGIFCSSRRMRLPCFSLILAIRAASPPPSQSGRRTSARSGDCRREVC